MKSSPHIKKHTIYKKDKWNMMFVEVHGKSLVLREITDQWGEECHTFLSRPEMMQWAHTRFPKEKYADSPEEYEAVMNAFAEV